MNQEKLKKLQALQAQVRIGGKGTPRRKKKVIHQTPGTDDKKLQSILKKLAVNQIPGIEEVNMIKNDGTIIHFNNPKAQASLAANTFAITGHSEQKEVSFTVVSSYLIFSIQYIHTDTNTQYTHSLLCSSCFMNSQTEMDSLLSCVYSIHYVYADDK